MVVTPSLQWFILTLLQKQQLFTVVLEQVNDAEYIGLGVQGCHLATHGTHVQP